MASFSMYWPMDGMVWGVYAVGYFQPISRFNEDVTMGGGKASPQKEGSFIPPGIAQHKPTTILLMERGTDLRNIITLTLIQLGMTVHTASNPMKARRILSKEDPDLFILELDKPEGENGELIDLFRQNNLREHTSVLLITARRPSDAWRNHYKPDVVIYKPFDIRFLIRIISGLIRQEEMHRNEISPSEWEAK